jgi:hypothetical protein
MHCNRHFIQVVAPVIEESEEIRGQLGRASFGRSRIVASLALSDDFNFGRSLAS